MATMSNPYSTRLLLAPSHKSKPLPIHQFPPPPQLSDQQSNPENQKWCDTLFRGSIQLVNQSVTVHHSADEHREQNGEQFTCLTDQEESDEFEFSDFEYVPSQARQPRPGKKNRKSKKKRKRLQEQQQPPEPLPKKAKKPKTVLRTMHVESGPVKVKRVQRNEKENKQISRVLAGMKAYEMSKSGFTETSRFVPTTTQYPNHTKKSQLQELEDAEDWSTAIRSLETQTSQQDARNRGLNLTRRPASPATKTKCEDNIERRDDDMYEDDSDLEEGEIREFPRQFPELVTPEVLLEVEPRIKEEPI